MTDPVVTPARLRVAPSPTGDPHVGTAYQALFDKAYALKTGGVFVLRVEDTDQARLVAGSAEQARDMLQWLGLTPDEGPWAGGEHGPYRQSERLDTYRPFVDQLLESGHAYHCWCSPQRLAEMREKAQAEKRDTRYDRMCHGMTREERAKLPGFQETPVVRMLVPDDAPLEFDDLINGTTKAPFPDDQVILKADGFPTYHLAVVVDDHLMGITHVIRGQEWISSTPKHMLLYRWLGFDEPRFAHTPLLREANKAKISKRKNPAARLTWFREQGYLPAALLNFLMLLGHPPVHEGDDVQSMDEFVEAFEWHRIDPSGPYFDVKKLDWLNGEYIRRTDADELGRLIVEYANEFQDAGWDEADADLVRRAAPLLQPRLTLLSEAKDQLRFLFTPDTELQIAEDAAAQLKDTAGDVLDAALAVLEGLEPWEPATIEAALRARLVDDMQIKPRFAFAPLRVGISGQKVSPPLFESMELLGHASTLTRLRQLRATL